MSLWRHGETKGNEVKSPEKPEKNQDGGVKTINEGDKKKLNPTQEFKNKYRVPENELNKSEGNKLSKPDNRPNIKGDQGRGPADNER